MEATARAAGRAGLWMDGSPSPSSLTSRFREKREKERGILSQPDQQLGGGNVSKPRVRSTACETAGTCGRGEKRLESTRPLRHAGEILEKESCCESR